MSEQFAYQALKENVDYELVPVDGIMNDQAWEVRILKGDFTETVIRFGNVAVDGKADQMTFNFSIIESPDPDLETTDEALQVKAGDILLAIIEDSIHNNWLVIKDKGTPIDE